LRRPATLALALGATRLEGLDVSSGEARLTAEALLDSTRLLAQLSLDSLPLDALDPFWDSGLAGEVNATINIAGSPDDPRGEARLSASGLRPRDNSQTPPLALATTAHWREGRLQARGELGGAAVAAARFAGEV